jgi:hypothetical protein
MRALGRRKTWKKKNLEQVMQNLIAMRNELVDAGRNGQPVEDWLIAINAILSCLLGTEFPHNGLQWQRICESREALRDLLMRA